MGFRMAKIFLTPGDFQRLKIKVKISMRRSQISSKKYDRYGGEMSIEDTFEVEYRLLNGTIKRSLKVKVKT